MAEQPTALDAFNRASERQVTGQLRGCCAASAWAERVAAGRPYADEAALYAASDRATAELDEAGLEQALGGHPRIGERARGGHGGGRAERWSEQEQARVGAAGAGLLAEVAAANAAYEERFGHVYLVCASGRSAEELLADCRSRLVNDRAAERDVVLGELAKINRVRLHKLLDAEAGA